MVTRYENSGTLDASNPNGKGGTVQVLGDKVGLASTSVIDASGATGGGTVLVGGDSQGKNATVPNASQTLVGSGATIKADATVQGDGGKVIVWSDEVTRHFGSISARGGAQGGNGGAVEVSGRNMLVFDGQVDVTSSLGQSGKILLDPLNVTIADTQSGTDDSFVSSVSNPNGVRFSVPDTATSITISDEAVEALTGSFEIQAHNNITIAKALDLAQIATGETATFTAGNSITISPGANITTAAGGNLVFTASDVGGAGASAASINISAMVAAAATESVTFRNSGTGRINLNPGGAVAAHSLLRFQGTLNLSGNTTLTAGTVSLDDVRGAVDLTINGSAQFGSVGNLSTLSVSGTLSLGAGNPTIDPLGNLLYGGATITISGGVTISGTGGQLAGGILQIEEGATITISIVPSFNRISGDLTSMAINPSAARARPLSAARCSRPARPARTPDPVRASA